MDYLKYAGSGVMRSTYTASDPGFFDTHGLMAKIRISDGTVYIVNGGTADGYYPLKSGDVMDFVGCIRYYGNATIEYLLFDKA